MSIGRQIAEFIVALLRGLFGREKPEECDVVILPEKSAVGVDPDDVRRKLDDLRRLRRDRAARENDSGNPEDRRADDGSGKREGQGQD